MSLKLIKQTSKCVVYNKTLYCVKANFGQKKKIKSNKHRGVSFFFNIIKFYSFNIAFFPMLISILCNYLFELFIPASDNVGRVSQLGISRQQY